jgi:ABC-type phosphate transport system auxiliary subunit
VRQCPPLPHQTHTNTQTNKQTNKHNACSLTFSSILEILKKGGFDQMKEALRKYKELIEMYEGALEKIKQQQTHFTNLQMSLSEVKAKCVDLDSLKDDDFEFLKLEFSGRFREVQTKLHGLYNSVESYLVFLKDKGLIEEIPKINPPKLF